MNLNSKEGERIREDYKAVEGKFFRAGTGGGALGLWEEEVAKEGVPREREGAPEEREGVLVEDTDDIREGAGGEGMVVPLCRRRVRGRTVGGGARPSVWFFSFAPFNKLSED